MRILKKALLVTLPIALLAIGVYFYNNWTDGFSARKLVSKLPYNILYEVGPLNCVEKERLATILDQPYRYIGKGCQFYAFESKDGKYVVKFFKQKHLRLCTELNNVPMPKFLRKKADAKIARRKQRVNNLFSSCKLAYEELAEESALQYIHLNRVPIFKQKITIIDRRGWKSVLNLDDYEFILQKKALPAERVFTKLQEHEIEARVEQLVTLVKKRCMKGIRDRDRSFTQNVAFSLDGKNALFIDIGQFYKDPTVLLEKEQQLDLQKRLNNLRFWVEHHNPELLTHLDQLISEI